MHPPAVTPHYRIADPVSGLCIRLDEIREPGQPPRIVTDLVPAPDASRFTSYRSARDAFARHIGVAVLEIERVDA